MALPRDSQPGSPLSRPAVRPLGPDDWETLARVRLTALEDAPDAFYSTLAAEEHRTEAEWRTSATTAAWFAALDADGAPAGLVAVVHDAPPPGDAMLISMWVAAAHRGAGLATGLVAAALDAAAARRQRLTLWVRRGNLRAIRAYERMGFEVQDPPPDAHDYRCEGELFMARAVATEG